MTNIIFQYSTLYLLSLFFGMSFCKHFEYLIKLEGNKKVSIGRGFIDAGEWTLLLDKTVHCDEKRYSVVIVRLIEEFQLSSKKTVSILENGKLVKKKAKLTEIKDWTISISLSPVDTNATLGKLKAIAEGLKAGNDWTTYSIGMMNVYKISKRHEISIELVEFEKPIYPNVMLLLKESSPIAQVFGYKMHSGIRFLGRDARRISEALITYGSVNMQWEEFNLKIQERPTEKDDFFSFLQSPGFIRLNMTSKEPSPSFLNVTTERI